MALAIGSTARGPAAVARLRVGRLRWLDCAWVGVHTGCDAPTAPPPCGSCHGDCAVVGMNTNPLAVFSTGFDALDLALTLIGSLRAPVERLQSIDPKLADQLRRAASGV